MYLVSAALSSSGTAASAAPRSILESGIRSLAAHAIEQGDEPLEQITAKRGGNGFLFVESHGGGFDRSSHAAAAIGVTRQVAQQSGEGLWKLAYGKIWLPSIPKRPADSTSCPQQLHTVKSDTFDAISTAHVTSTRS